MAYNIPLSILDNNINIDKKYEKENGGYKLIKIVSSSNLA